MTLRYRIFHVLMQEGFEKEVEQLGCHFESGQNWRPLSNNAGQLVATAATPDHSHRNAVQRLCSPCSPSCLAADGKCLQPEQK